MNSKFKIQNNDVVISSADYHFTETKLLQPQYQSYNKKYWDTIRLVPLTKNEQQVFKMIDTLKSMPLFKKYTNALTFIVDGRKKIGKIEIGPWYKWISRNQLEKWRFRFDVGTTEAFSKNLINVRV